MIEEPDAVALLMDQFPEGHPAADELIGLRSACHKLKAERNELRAEVKRLQDLFRIDGEQYAAHVRELEAKYEARHKLYCDEIEQLRSLVASLSIQITTCWEN